MRLQSLVLLCVALSAALPPSVEAQRRQRGWIGISLDIPTVDGRVDEDAVVLIADVRPGSPAEQAGLRAGDRLIAVGELRGADEIADLPRRLTLRVGERVRIRAARGARRFEVVVRAGERPDPTRPTTVRLPLEPDSLVETMMRAMDSLRVQLIEVAGARAPVAVSDRSRVRVVREGSAGRVSAPFEFFVFRSEMHDSLSRAMEDLRRTTEELRRREQIRIAELTRTLGAVGQVDVVEADQELRALRASLEQVTRESAELRAAMSEAARVTAGTRYMTPRAYDRWPGPPMAGDVTPDPVTDPEPTPTFRPLTPYLIGSNMVAGAQVVDLRPELARYFDVEGGVLIVDVAPGTPAAMAGMVPGDVVTRLDQVRVRSVEELRFGVSRSDESVPVSLVRRGSTLEVLLTRR